MKRVVLDARWIGPSPSGVGVYTGELIRRLPELAPDLHFHLLFNHKEVRQQLITNAKLAERSNVSSELLPYGLFAPSGQWRLAKQLQRLKADLFHSPNYMIPYPAFYGGRSSVRHCRCVTTIHDVIPLVVRNHAPQALKSRMLFLFRLCLRLSIRCSDSVITVSQTSRSDMIRALSLRETVAAKIEVVYNGVDSRFTPAAAPPPRKTIPTILYVGRLDPYKNVVTLVRAFGQVLREARQAAHLVIVGPDDPRYPEARQVTSDLGLNDHVSFLGFLRDDELVAAYQEATLLVNPSSYEGFGLQLIEAMRCDLPVVCCDGGAQPEVAGDAAIIVQTGNCRALADAIHEALFNPTRRQELIAKGRQRAADFDWQQTASETLAIYRRLLGTGGCA